jgi:hypothetical protein
VRELLAEKEVLLDPDPVAHLWRGMWREPSKMPLVAETRLSHFLN